MSTPTATTELYRSGQTLTAALILALRSLWARVDLADISGGWAAVRGPAVAAVTATQVTAARAGAAYVPDVLDELGLSPRVTAAVVPEALAVGSSGVPVDQVLDRVPLRALRTVNGGRPEEALQAGQHLLEGMARTLVADATRLASSMSIAAAPAVSGYIRMLNPPACSRCVVLAGRFYRWNTGFLRHPRCDCRHIPATEDMTGDLRTDPDAYFASLSPLEQDRAFTAAGARAIRDGADIGQVVNARRGANGLTPAGARLTAAEARALRDGRDVGRLQPTRLAGRDVFLTTEGTTRRGLAGKAMGNFERTRRPGERYTRSARQRLMPESIYQIATDRDDALRLLRLYGYLR